MPTVAGGQFLIPPLYVVASAGGVPESMRLWAIDRLEFVGRTMGIKQASAVAAVLRVFGRRTEIEAMEKETRDMLNDSEMNAVSSVVEGDIMELVELDGGL